jgi:hypothetical protein
VSHNKAFDFSATYTLSISLYVKVDAPNQYLSYKGSNDIISKWEDVSNYNANYPYAIRLMNQTTQNNGKISGIRFSRTCLEGPITMSTSSVLDGQFHHILFTRAADDSLRLYVDGQLESIEKDVTSCSTNNSLDMDFGRRGGVKNPSYFKGVIDEVEIYGCVLTPDDFNNDTCSIDLSLTIGQNFIASNDNDADSYQWYECSHGFPVILNNDTNRILPNLSTGNYMVIIRNDTCMDSSACVFYNANSVTQFNKGSGLKLFPNPSDGILNLEIDLKDDMTYSIHNSLGAIIEDGKLTDNSLNIHSYTDGFYFILVQYGSTIYSATFIKK